MPIQNSKRNHVSGCVKYTGVGKIGDFRRKSPFISETVRDRPMVTMDRCIVMDAGSNGIIFDDFE